MMPTSGRRTTSRGAIRTFAQAAIVFFLLAGLCSLSLTQEAPEASAQIAASDTPTETSAPTLTPLPTDTETPSAPTASETSSVTDTPTPTPTSTAVPTSTPSSTGETTQERTRTQLPTDTETLPAPTASETSSVTDTPTPTPTSTAVPTSTPSPTGKVTPAIDSESEYVPDEVLVKLRPGYTLETVAASLWSNVVEFEDGDDALKTLNIWVLSVPPGQVPPVVAALQGNPAVEFAEPNYIAQAYFVPNDPGLVQQTYLWNIQMAQAWDVTLSTPGVVVAVIDTGVDAAHPDLAAKIWHNLGELGTDAAGNDKRSNGLDDDGDGYVDDWQGWNVVGNSGNVQDDHGHGTHVAGTIAADTNNGQGIAGVAPNALIMPVKALDVSGFGAYSQVAEGILYAADHGARVINLSLGSPSPSGLLKAAVQYAYARGSVVIAAVGDSGSLGVNYPANYPNVIAVGATDLSNQLAPFSTFGDSVSLVAPGVDIYSTHPGGGYSQMSGTSMAAAHVSGVAALLASLPQFDTPDKIRAALQSSATDLGDPGWDMYYGFGLVQAFTAMNYAPGGMPTPTPIPAPTDTPGPTPTEPGGGLVILATSDLFSQTSMTRSNCTATNEANAYSPQSFDGVTGYCQFTAAGNWTYNNVQNTTLTAVYSATLTVRFYTANWLNDQVFVEISNDNGAAWNTVATFQTGSVPPTALTYYSYDVSSWIGTPTQANNAQVRFRVATVSGLDANLRIYSDQMRLSVSDVLPPVPTPTAPAPAPTSTPSTPLDPHVDYTANTDSCAACHRAHTASSIVLRQLWPEESVCFACHTSGGSGTNVQPAFTSYTNTATRIFKHDIASLNGVHRVGQNTGASFGGANRHVECEDCHEPHEATRGSASAPMIQRVMNYVSGVDPVWNAAGAPASYTWLPQAQREYQVCFKCHSSFTTLPTYQPDGWIMTSATTGTYFADGLRKLTSTDPLQVLDSRDKALEFNPYHTSFHPVVAKGRNTTINASTFVAGWSVNSLVYCTDCHTNGSPATGGNGPHGSPMLHLLWGTNNYETGMPNNKWPPLGGEVCFKCHKYSVYVQGGAGSGFPYHSYHINGSGSFAVASCYECHDSHGSGNQHLINFNAQYVTPDSGYNSQTAWVANGNTRTCYLTCHSPGGDSVPHGTGKSYTVP